MNWRLLANSAGVAFGAAALAAVAGGLLAVWFTTLPRRLRIAVHLAAIVALALPPFFVTNAWMQLFGAGGTLTDFLPLPLFSPGGAILILAQLYWPIAFLACGSGLGTMTRELLEVDLELRGLALLRHLLWPMIRGPLATGSLLIVVLALNQFSVPSLLQIHVLPAEVWVRYSSQLDTAAAFMTGWPLMLVPLGFVLLWRPLMFAASVSDGSAYEAALRRQLGRGCLRALRLIGVVWLVLSVILPLATTAGARRSWTELAGAGAASLGPIAHSTVFALATATTVMIAGLALRSALLRTRWRSLESFLGAALWVAFFVPGLFPAIVLLQWLPRSPFAWVQGTDAPSLLLLVGRNLAIGWQASRLAFDALDRDLVDAASLASISRWDWFRQVLWQQQRFLLAGAWYAVYLLTLWDVECQVLLQAPGGETLALRIFNLLHYGHNDQVNALCIHLLLIAVSPLLLWQLGRWAFGAGARRVHASGLIAAAALLLAGCSRQPEQRSAPLKSTLFRTVEIVGTRGTAAGEFNKPRSLAVDREDNLYVVDMTGRVQKFSPEGRFLLMWQLPQTDLGKPKGMTCDNNGNIVVVEPHYQRVNHFNPKGELVRRWGNSGTNQGQLTLPRSVALNSKGLLFVTEYTTVDRVQAFEGTNATPKLLFGRPGNGPGEFNRAEGIAIDSQDRIYIADSCNHRIQVFSPEGAFLRSYGRAGSAPGELSYPYDIRVDREGRQFVCEFGNSRIQVFDSADHPLETLGGYGAAPGGMNNPWSIALDSKGNLYVADAGNHRVQKFIRR